VPTLRLPVAGATTRISATGTERIERAQQPSDAPSSAPKPAVSKGCLGCLGVVGVLIFIAWVSQFGGSDGTVSFPFGLNLVNTRGQSGWTLFSQVERPYSDSSNTVPLRKK